jgi:hypothetical protein
MPACLASCSRSSARSSQARFRSMSAWERRGARRLGSTMCSSNQGAPPALPGGSRSLTFPGVAELGVGRPSTKIRTLSRQAHESGSGDGPSERLSHPREGANIRRTGEETFYFRVGSARGVRIEDGACSTMMAHDERDQIAGFLRRRFLDRLKQCSLAGVSHLRVALAAQRPLQQNGDHNRRRPACFSSWEMRTPINRAQSGKTDRSWNLAPGMSLT